MKKIVLIMAIIVAMFFVATPAFAGVPIKLVGSAPTTPILFGASGAEICSVEIRPNWQAATCQIEILPHELGGNIDDVNIVDVRTGDEVASGFFVNGVAELTPNPEYQYGRGRNIFSFRMDLNSSARVSGAGVFQLSGELEKNGKTFSSFFQTPSREFCATWLSVALSPTIPVGEVAMEFVVSAHGEGGYVTTYTFQLPMAAAGYAAEIWWHNGWSPTPELLGWGVVGGDGRVECENDLSWLGVLTSESLSLVVSGAGAGALSPAVLVELGGADPYVGQPIPVVGLPLSGSPIEDDEHPHPRR